MNDAKLETSKIVCGILGYDPEALPPYSERQLADDANVRLRAELDQLVLLDEEERKVLRGRLHVIEEILTCRCPRCHQAFLDFSGCFALKCSRCPCAFCAWCLADCGADAHNHVAVACQHKPDIADVYFGTEAQFNDSQQRRRRRDLATFLPTLEPPVRRAVLQALQGELRDLGLNAAAFLP